MSSHPDNSTVMKANQVRVRPKTKARLHAFAKTRRLTMVEAVDVAANALTALSPAQQEALIRTGKLDCPSVEVQSVND